MRLSKTLTHNIDVKYSIQIIQTILKHIFKNQSVNKVSFVCICWQSAVMAPWSKTIVCIMTIRQTDAAHAVHHQRLRQALHRWSFQGVLYSNYMELIGPSYSPTRTPRLNRPFIRFLSSTFHCSVVDVKPHHAGQAYVSFWQRRQPGRSFEDFLWTDHDTAVF